MLGAHESDDILTAILEPGSAGKPQAVMFGGSLTCDDILDASDRAIKESSLAPGGLMQARMKQPNKEQTMPKYPGTMNGFVRPPQPQRQVQPNFPWPPGQMATSNHEMKNRSDVEAVLKDLRRELQVAGLSPDDFVWGMRRNPAKLLLLYMFHADCVPSAASSREPWTWRPMSEGPPPAESWEVKFHVLVEQQTANVRVAANGAVEVREAGRIVEPTEPSTEEPK